MGDIQTDQGESLELRYRAPSRVPPRARRDGPPSREGARLRGAGAHQHALHDCRRVVRPHRHELQLARHHELAVPERDARSRQGPEAADIFFSSKGHDAPALYTVLIGLGLLPDEKLHQLRRLHGLPGHPHVETPYIQANTGSLGMGISKAKGMALANRLAGDAAAHLRADRRRRAAGRAVLGVARRRPPIAGSARSSPSSITTRFSRTPGSATSAISATSKRSSARSAGT